LGEGLVHRVSGVIAKSVTDGGPRSRATAPRAARLR
jgi:hypothetical protein